jgi:aldose 1-epimerase
LTKSVLGTMPDGKAVELYTLQDGPVKVTIASFGARIVSLEVPDRDGNIADIALGYASLKPYLEDPEPYFGALIGRYANRIGGAKFTLNGQQYTITRNNGPNSLHGGLQGFDSRLWQAQAIPQGVELTLVSPDGDQGYPGTLTTRARYTLENRELKIEYFATTNKETVVNLTNHTYFNLSGEGNGDILDHVVEIFADRYTPVDSELIPTGELAPVAGTPLDFRQPAVIGARIDQPDEQLQLAKGYDQNYVLGTPGELKEAARVEQPRNGRVLTVRTTEPGMQFYSGNFLDGSKRGKQGHAYEKRAGFCLETQHFPDSPNQSAFPSTVLKPGETFHSLTVYSFFVRPD